MKRLARACQILNQIIRAPENQWSGGKYEEDEFLIVTNGKWHALIHYGKPALPRTPPDERSADSKTALCGRMAGQQLELWINGIGKVLTASLDGHKIDFQEMKRGSWEHQLFDLPPRDGKGSPSIN